jgi:hypothetical protein
MHYAYSGHSTRLSFLLIKKSRLERDFLGDLLFFGCGLPRASLEHSREASRVEMAGLNPRPDVFAQTSLQGLVCF